MPRNVTAELDDDDLFDPDLEFEDDDDDEFDDDEPREPDPFSAGLRDADVVEETTTTTTTKKAAKTAPAKKKAAPAKKKAAKKKTTKKKAAADDDDTPPEPAMRLPHTPPQPAPSAAPPQPRETGLDAKRPWGDGPSPLELGAARDGAMIEIDRRVAYNDSTGHPGGGSYTGVIGQVPHRPGFKLETRRRWGGGEYVARGYVNGEVRENTFEIGMPSVDPGDERRESRFPEVDRAFSEHGYPPGYDSPYGPPLGGPPELGYPPAGPYPPPGAGYPGAGYPPAPGPYGDPMSGFGRRFSVDDDEEKRELREQLAELQRQNAETRTAMEVERVRRQAEANQTGLMNQVSRLEAKIEGGVSAPGKNGSEMLEFMRMQATQEAARREEDRKAEQRRWEQEQAERKNHEQEQRRIREEKAERWEVERKDRLEREDRDRQRREEEDRKERLWRKEQAARDDEWRKTMAASQAKPLDMIQLLGALKEVSSPSDPMGQLHSMLGVVEQINEIKNGGGSEETSSAERMVRTVGETAGPILAELAQAWTKRSEPAQAQPLTQEQHQALLYQQHQQQLLLEQQRAAFYAQAPQGQAPGLPQPAPAQAAPQQQQGPAPLTPQKWGEILNNTVQHAEAGTAPLAAVQNLFLLCQEIEAEDAIRELAEGTVDKAVNKARAAKLVVTDARYRIAIDKFVALGEPGTSGRAWLDAYFGVIREGWAEVLRIRSGAAAPPPSPPAPVVGPLPAEAAAEEYEESEEGF